VEELKRNYQQYGEKRDHARTKWGISCLGLERIDWQRQPVSSTLNGVSLQGPWGGTATRLAFAPPLVGVVADCLALSKVLRLLHGGVVHRVIDVTCQAQSIVRLYRTAATSANLTQVTSMFRVGPDTSQCLIPVPASDRVFTQTHVHFCTVMKFTNSR
jgi:hypothetical protein